MRRVFSGTAPSGRLTLGNYLGAVKHWVAAQHEAESLFCVVDLHALTAEHDPRLVRDRTREIAGLLLAAGLDPHTCTIFVQSQVPAHAQLTWLLESTVYDGELRRMIQYKEKARKQGRQVRASLLTYPALMAADILLYDVAEVPVGEDQRQHVELARDLALRFNKRYGRTFVVPQVVLPDVAAKVMDLSEPSRKMDKSAPEDAPGVIFLLDSPEAVRRKIMRAVTDTRPAVRYDPVAQPGISNLLVILAACVGEPSATLAERYSSYRALKSDTAEAVIETLRPLQADYRQVMAEPAALAAVLRAGAEHAATLAGPTLRRAQEAIGLLAP
jgi:tryptophanyl-tRNA synthetase